ncbi:MAG: purine-binding chemotaxis protein CheW, partial [Sulfurimonas sp.]|nr:purine-binding chemotaxis protein CheW [Sulfurimonas sp.]
MSEIKKTKELSSANRFLTFFVDEEQYGIDISKIKEIIAPINITHIPKTPDFVKGVINLRGSIIPVIDLRLKFTMGEIPYTDRTCIIVVEIESDASTVLIGIVVDAVSEVLNVRG